MDGGDIQSLVNGRSRWAEVEMTDVLDLYLVTLTFDYEGNEELRVDSGERTYQICISSDRVGEPRIFKADRSRLLEDKRDKIEEMQRTRKNL